MQQKQYPSTEVLRRYVREVAEAHVVLNDPQRRREHDRDLALSRTCLDVTPEPLIPDTPTYVPFRRSVFDFDQEFLRMFQIFENVSGM